MQRIPSPEQSMCGVKAWARGWYAAQVTFIETLLTCWHASTSLTRIWYVCGVLLQVAAPPLARLLLLRAVWWRACSLTALRTCRQTSTAGRRSTTGTGMGFTRGGGLGLLAACESVCEGTAAVCASVLGHSGWRDAQGATLSVNVSNKLYAGLLGTTWNNAPPAASCHAATLPPPPLQQS